MPRDGSGVYSLPGGVTAVTLTTIGSAAYNSFLSDLVADLNAARPIVAGGTGATTAAGARANLGVTTTPTARDTTGSSNAYALTSGDSLSAYADGYLFIMVANHSNTGAATIDLDSVGAKALQKTVAGAATALAAGDLKAGGHYVVTYDASVGSGTFIVHNPTSKAVIDGTVSLPGLAFADDPDTGLYRIGANNFGAAVGGAKILDVKATGLEHVFVERLANIATGSLPAAAAGNLGAVAFDTTLARVVANLSGSAWAPLAMTSDALAVDVQIFDADGTWTKPAGATVVYAALIGGGGAGGKALGTTRCGGGGGGGGFAEGWFDADDLGATEAVVVGDGGTGTATVSTIGGTGGTTTFAGLSAYGGGGGAGTVAGDGAGGGGGGGVFGAGAPGGTAGTGGGAGGAPYVAAAAGNYNAGMGGGKGGGGGATADGNPGDSAAWGGSGGGGGCEGSGRAGGAGGASIRGGGGGGGATVDGTVGAGGVSTCAGNGGAGGTGAGDGGAGVAPGGGGGGTMDGTSGAGAPGRVIVVSW